MDVADKDWEKAEGFLRKVRAADLAQASGEWFGWFYLLVVAGFTPKQAMQIIEMNQWGNR